MLQSLSRYYHILTGLVWLCSAIPLQADESIADIQHLHQHLGQGKYELNLLAVATLSNISVNGLKVSELSGLAWDQDEKLLYALSDNGYILVMQPVFSGRILIDILLRTGHRLLDENGHALKYRLADSEGLAIEHGNNGKPGDSRLIISFERVPRLVRYKPDGTFVANISLPAELDDVAHYQSENQSLEAVASDSNSGILVGTEYPLKAGVIGTLNIYSLDGDHWSFPAHDISNGALVDMTTGQSGKIIALERVYNGFLSGIQTTLHQVILTGTAVQAEQIYTFVPETGIFNDNFEGITHLDGDHYMMISDDNNHPLKRTLLVYFEIRERKY